MYGIQVAGVLKGADWLADTHTRKLKQKVFRHSEWENMEQASQPFYRP